MLSARGSCESHPKLFLKEQGCVHAFTFLSSMFISVGNREALSVLESDAPVLVLLHLARLEVCRCECEWPFLRPARKQSAGVW